MNINPWIWPTLVAAILLFGIGWMAWLQIQSTPGRIVLAFVGLAAAIPAFLFCFYYGHFMDHAAWFYQFRTWRGSELASAGAGFLMGMLAGACRNHRFGSKMFHLMLLTLTIALPHIKPVVAPLDPDRLKNLWRDGVCLQSSDATCGPAAAATLFNQLGLASTEAELARECFTYRGGTELWYLARAARKRGLSARFVCVRPAPPVVPAPSIAGVRVGRSGHFIAVLSASPVLISTADPLSGRQEHRSAEAHKAYQFTGIFLVLEKPNQTN